MNERKRNAAADVREFERAIQERLESEKWNGEMATRVLAARARSLGSGSGAARNRSLFAAAAVLVLVFGAVGFITMRTGPESVDTANNTAAEKTLSYETLVLGEAGTDLEEDLDDTIDAALEERMLLVASN